jgi:biopolymer transport protein ExbD/biopolymer transport protein TolR
MARRRRSTPFEVNAEVSVTSLVDVAFTLLVIFIITAPILQGGVDVQVPRAQAETISSPDGIVVSVTREGALYIGPAEATWEEFEAALTDAVRTRQATGIYLRADAGVEYGRVLQVLGAMRALDIATVGLVADPETPLRGGGGGR